MPTLQVPFHLLARTKSGSPLKGLKTDRFNRERYFFDALKRQRYRGLAQMRFPMKCHQHARSLRRQPVCSSVSEGRKTCIFSNGRQSDRHSVPRGIDSQIGIEDRCNHPHDRRALFCHGNPPGAARDQTVRLKNSKLGFMKVVPILRRT